MKKRILTAIITIGLLVGVTANGQNSEVNNIDNKQVINHVLQVNSTSRASQTGKVINVTSNLRIREKPSTNSNILGYLYGGNTVNIISKTNGWYEIEAKGIKGYVSADYISVNGDSSNNIDNSTENNNMSGKYGQVINVTTSLRIRQSASTSSAVIGSLRGGDKFEILSKSNGWYKIKSNGTVGYVHGDYVKVLDGNSNSGSSNGNTSSSKPETNGKIETGKVVNVSTSLRMRSDASTSASIIGSLYQGNTFEIHGQKNGWYYIKHNNKFGYVHGDYVQKISGNSNSTGSNAGNSGSTETNQSKYETVLNAMKKNIGTPYVFGGSGEIISDSLISSLSKKYPGQRYDVPSEYRNGNYRAFDCSGLMQWGFKQGGISLGRTTYDQVKQGQAVSRSNIKPGDLVFYSDLSHVGMYVGNNQMIESPRTGSKVRIIDVPWNKIGQIRRVL
ncbi:SH3 domain-containing protein [Clostridium sp.]|uniref:C40 family peptidase n=1 Tax=Clostridium sp. TaxID=1506 RepID=UPI003995E1EC